VKHVYLAVMPAIRIEMRNALDSNGKLNELELIFFKCLFAFFGVWAWHMHIIACLISYDIFLIVLMFILIYVKFTLFIYIELTNYSFVILSALLTYVSTRFTVCISVPRPLSSRELPNSFEITRTLQNKSHPILTFIKYEIY